MGGFIEPSPATQERDSNRIPILVGMGLVIVVVGIIALFSRGQSKGSAAPHPYAANLKISDVKMSAALDKVVATTRRHGKYAMTLIGNNLDVDYGRRVAKRACAVGIEWIGPLRPRPRRGASARGIAGLSQGLRRSSECAGR